MQEAPVNSHGVRSAEMLPVSAPEDPSPIRASVPPHIQRELRTIYFQLTGNGPAYQIWHNVLSDDERERLGNDLQAALLEHQGAIQLFMKLRHLELPHALLELATQLGWLPDAARRRLERFVGGIRSTSLLPKWDGQSKLTYDGQTIRQLRGRGVATNAAAILDAFEEQGWPDRVDDPFFGNRSDDQLRRGVATLNHRLSLIHFACDGSGTGVSWGFASI